MPTPPELVFALIVFCAIIILGKPDKIIANSACTLPVIC